MDIEVIRRLALARHLFELGLSSLRSGNDLQLFAAVNLLQDSAEAFLIATAEYVGADFDQYTKFDKYFVNINAKITPKELPFKAKLLRLNRIRIDAKHHGIQPARDECERVAVSTREFFDEVSQSVLGVVFATVSAIDLLDEGEPRRLLLEAKAALEMGQLAECVVNCRKAIYLEVERHYDVSSYKNGKPLGLFDGFTRAPFYAQNKDYIENNVKNPTDFIVRDHSRIDQELLTSGSDTTGFWNIWRLTPEVFRDPENNWVVKHDFGKLDAAVLEDKAEYIFSTTIDVLLSLHANRRRARASEHSSYFVELKNDGVPVLERADVNSKVVGHTPIGLSKIDTDFRVAGLNDHGPYWFVYHFEQGKPFLIGYIHNDHVK